MKKNPRSLALLAASVLLVVSAHTTAAEHSASYMAAFDSIRPTEMQAYVDHLADDELEGREAGAVGGRQSGDFLVARLKQLGIQPAGLDGGFFQPFGEGYRNILAVIPGSDPELAEEFILVGAHYDHVGYGTRYNSRGRIGQIHNGADDNASGTAGVLEVAEAFSLLPIAPRRSILFVFWDAEEKGLLGSRHWAKEPTLDLRQVAAVLNLDMIGRLRDNRLLVYGTRTGYRLRRLVSRGNEQTGLTLDFSWEMTANTDHHTFFQRGIPVLFLNTGTTDEYHTPDDDADLLNSTGMARTSQMVFAVTHELAHQDQVAPFRELGRHELESTKRTRQSEIVVPPMRLGIQWSSKSAEDAGMAITSVTGDSPAARAGLLPGDRILQFGGRAVGTSDQLSYAVMSAKSPAVAVIDREGESEPLELAVELNGNPLRLGVTWRVDDADSGVLILTHIVAGSPAAEAGLTQGDRVYQINRRDFADELEFGRFARTLAAPLKLRVERDGQIREVTLDVTPSSDREA